MKNLILIIIFFFTSCSSNNIKKDFDFSNDMSFDEFKFKLEEYSKNNPYPNIDN